MKVIAINGSARKDGNTDILIEKVFEQLNSKGIETEMVQMAGQNFEPCKACWGCGGNANCVFQNDIFQETFEKLKAADGVILGSPVYSANISSNMQAFLERAAVIADMNPGLFKHKVGASVAAARRGGSLNTLDAMDHFFMNHEMFIVGSTYWNMVYGQMPGDVLNDEEGMDTMRNLGDNMAFLLSRLNV